MCDFYSRSVLNKTFPYDFMQQDIEESDNVVRRTDERMGLSRYQDVSKALSFTIKSTSYM